MARRRKARGGIPAGPCRSTRPTGNGFARAERRDRRICSEHHRTRPPAAADHPGLVRDRPEGAGRVGQHGPAEEPEREGKGGQTKERGEKIWTLKTMRTQKGAHFITEALLVKSLAVRQIETGGQTS